MGRLFYRGLGVGVAVLLAVLLVAAQPNKYGSQEVSESDGIPVLMKHLPEYESVASRAVFAKDVVRLKGALGDRPELNLIDFTPGTEAVTASYPAGKLLIVEYTSPQASVEADTQFQQAVAGNQSIVYRRIGNYNAFVFDVSDAAAANALLDQVKYEKSVQWLGDPPVKSKSGVTVPQMANVLLSSVLLLGVAGILALGVGALVGFGYFRWMEKQRATMTAYTDAGGMTRLNLDGFTPDILPERLLGE